MKKLLFSGLSLGLLIFAAGSVSATMYSYDFELATPPEITGGTRKGTEGYRTGTQDYPPIFGEYFQWSSSSVAPITLTLHGLGTHSFLNLEFDLAIIDSWDGDYVDLNNPCDPLGPDYFRLEVDGSLIKDVLLAQNWLTGTDLWGSSFPDSYDRYNITLPHSASSVTIKWFAYGAGWQGDSNPDDESYAIDNIRLSLSETGFHPIPEPATMLLFGAGLAGLAAVGRRRKTE